MTERPTVSKLSLYSVLPQQGLLSQFDAGLIAKPSSREELLALWRNASGTYGSSTDGPSRSFASNEDVRQLEDVDDSKKSATLERVKLYPPHDSHATDLLNVRIAKLVTPQLTINLKRAEKRATLKQDMTNGELFDLAFQPAQNPDPITRQILGIGPANGTILFTSYDEDIRLHHPPEYRKLPRIEKDAQSQLFENACFAIGGGYPFAAAYRLEITKGVFRLILSNGIHRAYSLAKAGYEWCPLVVTDLVPLELGDPFVDLQKDILLDPNSNPPLITDFLNGGFVIPVEYYEVLKSVLFSWNFNQYATVLR